MTAEARIWLGQKLMHFKRPQKLPKNAVHPSNMQGCQLCVSSEGRVPHTKCITTWYLAHPWSCENKGQVPKRKRNPLHTHQCSRRARLLLQVCFVNTDFLLLAFFFASFLLQVSPKIKQFPRQIQCKLNSSSFYRNITERNVNSLFLKTREEP